MLMPIAPIDPRMMPRKRIAPMSWLIPNSLRIESDFASVGIMTLSVRPRWIVIAR